MTSKECRKNQNRNVTINPFKISQILNILERHQTVSGNSHRNYGHLKTGKCLLPSRLLYKLKHLKIFFCLLFMCVSNLFSDIKGANGLRLLWNKTVRRMNIWT